jgi:hypothetical protein
LVIISLTIGLIIVGGLAVFSIYLQQDKLVTKIHSIALTKQSCLERWDYLKIANEKTEDHQLVEDNRELNMEFFITSGCVDSFREWMPITHSSWDGFVDFEIKKEPYCEEYVNGRSSLPEWAEPIVNEMCKDFLN